VGEFADQTYRDGKYSFYPCPSHSEVPVVDVVKMLMTERVSEKADQYAAEAVEAEKSAAAEQARKAEELAQRNMNRVAGRLPRPNGRPNRPATAEPKKPGIRLASHGLSPHAAAALAGSAMSMSPAPMDLDTVPEDERVTNLIEEMGFVDTAFEEKSIGPMNP